MNSVCPICRVPEGYTHDREKHRRWEAIPAEQADTEKLEADLTVVMAGREDLRAQVINLEAALKAAYRALHKIAYLRPPGDCRNMLIIQMEQIALEGLTNKRSLLTQERG